MQVLERARAFDPDLAVIMITAHGSEKAAVQAMKLGATDYLPKPFDNDELRVVVRRAMEGVAAAARPPPAARAGAEALRLRAASSATSPAMRRLFETIDRIADTDVTVLDPRRERHRQGAGRERAPLPQPAARASRSSR